MSGVGKATALKKGLGSANTRAAAGRRSVADSGSSTSSAGGTPGGIPPGGAATKLADLKQKSNQNSMLDKVKNKRRDGTPEKSGTPSQDAVQDEGGAQAKNFIWDEEIESLQIKEEQLQMIHEPRRPSAEKKGSAVTSSLIVRKKNPTAEFEKPKVKTFTVSRPAPPDAHVKPADDMGYAGPRYNKDGNVIPHSILGSYDEFQKEAIKRGDLLDLPLAQKEDVQPATPTLKYEKKSKRDHPAGKHTDEHRALKNWQQRMLERKKQQGYISRLLQKHPEDLIMNQADNYRTVQEERYLVDRTIPAVDYGKGYRVGSEFWKQQERFGDDLMGVHMTLTQTEKGYPPPVEHVGLPQSIRLEKGWNWSPMHRAPIHYPWHESPYLSDRKKQLQSLMNDLDPHQPTFDGLEVIGTANPFSSDVIMDDMQTVTSATDEHFAESVECMKEKNIDPLHAHPDVHPPPIFGPSIQFAGQPARWTGDSSSFGGQIGIEARVTFESCTADRVTSYLIITNDGTTSIYYDWKKLPKDNPFDLAQSHIQRFYFNNSSGVILPGEMMKFPFVFKSPNAGLFTEQWKFETRPVVCGGAALIVTLRGIAIQDDKYKKERHSLERDLQYKEAEQIVQQLLYEIIDGLQTADRPPSPIDNYITDEELFCRLNPKIKYNHEYVQEMRKLVKDSFPDEIDEKWTREMSLDDIRMKILSLDEDDERKEILLNQMNLSISKMAFGHQQPTQQLLYKIGYGLMAEAVDEVVGQSVMIRQITGLPEKDDDLADDGAGASGKKGSKVAKDKKAEPAGKDPKGIKKELTKPDLKGKSTPVAKKPPSRAASIIPGAAPDRTTPLDSSMGSADSDPLKEKKYQEKLYSQTYQILSDMANRMEKVFDAIMKSDPHRRPLRL